MHSAFDRQHQTPTLSLYRWSIRIASSLILGLALACGGGGGGGGTSTPPADPTITSFTAAKSPIMAGESTTLTAVFANGTGVVDQGVGTVTTGVAKAVSPTASTTYTLTVTGAAGTTPATQTAQVTVVPAGGPLLTVTITGVTTADVSFTGHSNLTATTVIDCTSLADGVHTLIANNVSEGGAQHYPWLRTQTVTVTSGVPSVHAVTVLYPAPTQTVTLPGSVLLDFVLVPPGSFQMGSTNPLDQYVHPPSSLSATPVHPVTVSHAFYVAKYPCTQAQWMAVTGDNPSTFSVAHGYLPPDDLNRPVETVSWGGIRDSGEYLDQLNGLGLGTFRLPSEAEYEYVVRAGTTTEYFFGDDSTNLSNYAWWNQPDPDPIGHPLLTDPLHWGGPTSPVTLRLPNPWGLYDIIGNVWEWCEDDSHATYTSAPSDGTAWVDAPRGANRIVRGGEWTNDDNSPRSAFRYLLTPGTSDPTTGFRVVMDIVP